MSSVPDHRAVDPARPAGAVQIGRIGSVPVYIAGSWALGAIVLVGLYASQTSALFASAVQTLLFALCAVAILFCSVFLHECAHAVVAQAFGHRVLNITLTFWGGVTRHLTYHPHPLSAALIALAGPAANFVLAGLGYACAQVVPYGTGAVVLQLVIWTNLMLGVYNVLPGLPLDGGQVPASIAWALTKNHTTGLAVGAWAGRVIVAIVAVVVVVSGLSGGGIGLLWTVLLVVTMWQMTSSTMRVVRQRRELDRITAGVAARPAILLPETTPQQLSFAYTVPGRAFVVHNDRALTGVVPNPGARCTGPLDPVRLLAMPVQPEPFDCAPDTPVTDYAIAMNTEQRPAIVLRFPDGQPRVLTIDDIVKQPSRDGGRTA